MNLYIFVSYKDTKNAKKINILSPLIRRLADDKNMWFSKICKKYNSFYKMHF